MKKTISLNLCVLLLFGSIDSIQSVYIKSEIDGDKDKIITISFLRENKLLYDYNNQVQIDKKEGNKFFSLEDAIQEDDDMYRKIKSKEIENKLGTIVESCLWSQCKEVKNIHVYFEDLSKENHLRILAETIDSFRYVDGEEYKKIKISVYPPFNNNSYQNINEKTRSKAEKSLKNFKKERKEVLRNQEMEDRELKEIREYNRKKFIENNYPKGNIYKGEPSDSD